MSDLKKFDVRYTYNGLIVVAVVVFLAALQKGNRDVMVMALGFIGLGFGARVQYAPKTYINKPPGTKYTVMEFEPHTLGWIIIAISACVTLFGLYRLAFSPMTSA
jgi:hypothetical protein